MLDAKLAPCGTFIVKHELLWKLKATARRPLERKLALNKGLELELEAGFEWTPTQFKPVDTRILTHV